jgi:hypothetical protein
MLAVLKYYSILERVVKSLQLTQLPIEYEKYFCNNPEL